MNENNILLAFSQKTLPLDDYIDGLRYKCGRDRGLRQPEEQDFSSLADRAVGS